MDPRNRLAELTLQLLQPLLLALLGLGCNENSFLGHLARMARQDRQVGDARRTRDLGIIGFVPIRLAANDVEAFLGKDERGLQRGSVKILKRVLMLTPT